MPVRLAICEFPSRDLSLTQRTSEARGARIFLISSRLLCALLYFFSLSLSLSLLFFLSLVKRTRPVRGTFRTSAVDARFTRRRVMFQSARARNVRAFVPLRRKRRKFDQLPALSSRDRELIGALAAHSQTIFRPRPVIRRKSVRRLCAPRDRCPARSPRSKVFQADFPAIIL